MVHPTSGFYVKDGHEYVSYSTLVGATDHIFNPEKVKGLEIWRAKESDADSIMEDAQKRGKLIHHDLELLFGSPIEEDIAATIDELIGLRIPDYVMNFSETIQFLADSKKDRLVEDENYSSKYGFACTTDYKGWIGFEKQGREFFLSETAEPQYTVVDWKTIRPPDPFSEEEPKAKPRSHHRDNFLQLGANALAHNEEVKAGRRDAPIITQGAIIALYSWREPRIHVLDLEELREYAVAFIQRCRAYADIVGETFPRPISDSNTNSST